MCLFTPSQACRPSAHNAARPHLQRCIRAERNADPRKLLARPPQSQPRGLGRRLSCNGVDMLVREQVTTARRQARGGHVACTPAAGRVSDLSTEVQTPARDSHRGQGMGHLPAVHTLVWVLSCTCLNGAPPRNRWFLSTCTRDVAYTI